MTGKTLELLKLTELLLLFLLNVLFFSSLPIYPIKCNKIDLDSFDWGAGRLSHVFVFQMLCFVKC